MRILIFDDEQEIAERIKENIKIYFENINLDDVDITCISKETDVISIDEADKYDVYFLDICSETDEIFGIKAAKKIRAKSRDAHIVFITAFEQYLQTALEELIRPSGYIFKDNMERQIIRTMDSIMAEKHKDNEFFSIQDREKRYVKFEDILYICYNSISKRNEIHLKNDGIISVRKSIAKLIEGNEEHFIMINRSVVGCKRNIRRASVNYLKKSVAFDDGAVFQPSRGGVRNLKNYFNN